MSLSWPQRIGPRLALGFGVLVALLLVTLLQSAIARITPDFNLIR